MVICWAIGDPASPLPAITVIAAADALAIISMIPGGFGIRESVIALLGDQIGLDANSAMTAALLDRLVTVGTRVVQGLGGVLTLRGLR
jgi:uncharacterized protein (TIRG00374 family)